MNKLSKVLFYLIILFVIIITVVPFLMMFLGSFKSNYEIMTLRPRLLPQNGFNFLKYDALFDTWPFFRNIVNSFFISGTVTLIACFLSALIGFVFAKYKFPGRTVFFVILLSSMMIPLESRLVPSYILIRALGGINRYWALIVPQLVPTVAFGVFMMRQYVYSGVPIEFLEAARIEGASESQIFIKIGLPILKPALISLAILTFMNIWNEFLWTLVVVTKKELYTVTVALQSLSDVSLQVDYGIVFAAATVSALPILVIYILTHKKMTEGMLEGGGKEI